MSGEDTKYPKGQTGVPRTLEAQIELSERRFSPSVSRNRDVIKAVFLEHLPAAAAVLEIGSGTGEHGIHLTEDNPDLCWTFTEYSEEALSGIAAWINHAGRPNLKGPHQVDAAASNWGSGIEGQSFDMLFSANVVHISPPTVLEGMAAGAGRLLEPEGRLVFYGPFSRHGDMVESNRSFDADLKRRDPRWGVRDVERDIIPLADQNGLTLAKVIDMPANNLILVFARD